MDNLFAYIIESTLIITALYLVYVLFLKRDTMFTAHRVYLLASLGAATLFPLLNVNILMPAENFVIGTIMLDPVIINAESEMVGAVTDGWAYNGLTIVYVAGMILFAVLFLSKISNLLALIFRKKNKDQIIRTDKNQAPFSFFGYIFIPEGVYSREEVEKIRIHEEAHVQQWHSIDILFLEVLFPLFWFNPIFWLLKKELKSTHEYLADRQVIRRGHNVVQYQKLLYFESTGMRMNPVSNNFNQSLIKKRIVMMTRPKVTRGQAYKYFFVAPLSVFIALFLAFNLQQDVMGQGDVPPPPPKSPESAMAVGSATEAPAIPVGQKEEQVYKEVDEMPTYKGGMQALGTFFVENVKYPQKAKEDGISGTVYVSFIVKKNGTISNITLKKGVDPSLDAEALRVVDMMPAWNPGIKDKKPVNVSMVLPVKFNLDEGAKKKEM